MSASFTAFFGLDAPEQLPKAHPHHILIVPISPDHHLVLPSHLHEGTRYLGLLEGEVGEAETPPVAAQRIAEVLIMEPVLRLGIIPDGYFFDLNRRVLYSVWYVGVVNWTKLPASDDRQWHLLMSAEWQKSNIGTVERPAHRKALEAFMLLHP